MYPRVKYSGMGVVEILWTVQGKLSLMGDNIFLPDNVISASMSLVDMSNPSGEESGELVVTAGGAVDIFGLHGSPTRCFGKLGTCILASSQEARSIL